MPFKWLKKRRNTTAASERPPPSSFAPGSATGYAPSEPAPKEVRRRKSFFASLRGKDKTPPPQLPRPRAASVSGIPPPIEKDVPPVPPLPRDLPAIVSRFARPVEVTVLNAGSGSSVGRASPSPSPSPSPHPSLRPGYEHASNGTHRASTKSALKQPAPKQPDFKQPQPRAPEELSEFGAFTDTLAALDSNAGAPDLGGREDVQETTRSARPPDAYTAPPSAMRTPDGSLGRLRRSSRLSMLPVEREGGAIPSQLERDPAVRGRDDAARGEHAAPLAAPASSADVGASPTSSSTLPFASSTPPPTSAVPAQRESYAAYGGPQEMPPDTLEPTLQAALAIIEQDDWRTMRGANPELTALPTHLTGNPELMLEDHSSANPETHALPSSTTADIKSEGMPEISNGAEVGRPELAPSTAASAVPEVFRRPGELDSGFERVPGGREWIAGTGEETALNQREGQRGGEAAGDEGEGNVAQAEVTEERAGEREGQQETEQEGDEGADEGEERAGEREGQDESEQAGQEKGGDGNEGQAERTGRETTGERPQEAAQEAAHEDQDRVDDVRANGFGGPSKYAAFQQHLHEQDGAYRQQTSRAESDIGIGAEPEEAVGAEAQCEAAAATGGSRGAANGDAQREIVGTDAQLMPPQANRPSGRESALGLRTGTAAGAEDVPRDKAPPTAPTVLVDSHEEAAPVDACERASDVPDTPDSPARRTKQPVEFSPPPQTPTVLTDAPEPAARTVEPQPALSSASHNSEEENQPLSTSSAAEADPRRPSEPLGPARTTRSATAPPIGLAKPSLAPPTPSPSTSPLLSPSNLSSRAQTSPSSTASTPTTPPSPMAALRPVSRRVVSAPVKKDKDEPSLDDFMTLFRQVQQNRGGGVSIRTAAQQAEARKKRSVDN